MKNTKSVRHQVRALLMNGLSKEELQSMDNSRVAPGTTVQDYVNRLLDFGEVEESDDGCFYLKSNTPNGV